MKYMITITTFLLTLTSIAQDKLSARGAVIMALENNYALQIAKNNVSIAEKNNKWSEAGLFPTVQLTAGYSNTLQDNSQNPLNFVQENLLFQNINPGVNMNWNLFSGMGIKISKDRLTILEQQSKGELMLELENVALDVLKAYNNILLQQENLVIYKALLDYSKTQLKHYELRAEIGQSNEMEIFQFKNQVLTDSINCIQQELNLNNAKRNLLVLMNTGVENLDEFDFPVLSDSLNTPTRTLDKTQTIEQCLSNNQNLKNQYIDLEMKEKMISYRRSFLFPTLSLQASANSSWGSIRFVNDINNPQNSQQIIYNAGLSLRYDLFNNWKNKRAVEVAKINANISELNTNQMTLELKRNILELFDNYQLQTQLVSLSEQNTNYAKQAFDLGVTKFEKGIISSLELQNLRNNYLEAALEYKKKLFEKLNLYFDIYKISGHLQLSYKNEI